MKMKIPYELQREMAAMNAEGVKLLINTAKAIAGREKYRKADNELTPRQFDRQVKKVLAMVERNYRRTA